MRYPGTTKSKCDDTNGICECRDGYNGTKCDQCAYGFFTTTQPGSASTICSKCGCNPEGTSNDECNADTGYCSCKDGYEGIKCNQCSTGYFNSNTSAAFSVCSSKFSFKQIDKNVVFLKPCFFPACECYVNGTDICDNMNGNCHCSVGYMGETCRNCSEGFFNSGSIENPICQGILILYMISFLSDYGLL